MLHIYSGVDGIIGPLCKILPMDLVIPVRYMVCYYKIFINILLFQTKLFISVLFLLCVLANTCTFEFARIVRGVQLVEKQ